MCVYTIAFSEHIIGWVHHIFCLCHSHCLGIGEFKSQHMWHDGDGRLCFLLLLFFSSSSTLLSKCRTGMFKISYLEPHFSRSIVSTLFRSLARSFICFHSTSFYTYASHFAMHTKRRGHEEHRWNKKTRDRHTHIHEKHKQFSSIHQMPIRSVPLVSHRDYVSVCAKAMQ